VRIVVFGGSLGLGLERAEALLRMAVLDSDWSSG
jgi:hypothetical protein